MESDDFDRCIKEIENQERGANIRRELYKKKYLGSDNVPEPNSGFKMRMIQMQVDMINHHYPHFNEETKKRADDTLKYLQNEYNWCLCLMKDPKKQPKLKLVASNEN